MQICIVAIFFCYLTWLLSSDSTESFCTEKSLGNHHFSLKNHGQHHSGSVWFGTFFGMSITKNDARSLGHSPIGKNPSLQWFSMVSTKSSTKIYPGNEHVPTQGMFEDFFFQRRWDMLDMFFFWRIPSLKLTWHLKMMVSNRSLLFQRSIFRCENVSFRECRHELLAHFLSEDSVVCLRIGGWS